MKLKRMTYAYWFFVALNFMLGTVCCAAILAACKQGRPIHAAALLAMAVWNFTDFAKSFPTEPT